MNRNNLKIIFIGEMKEKKEIESRPVMANFLVLSVIQTAWSDTCAKVHFTISSLGLHSPTFVMFSEWLGLLPMI